jgi:competence protein ComEA
LRVRLSTRRAIVTLSAILLLAPLAYAAPQQPSAASEAKAASVPTVNINTATVEQLDKLPGIGPKVAARIIEHRQKNGPFKKVEELMNVKGIGEKSFLKLKSQVTVTTPPLGMPRD